MRLLKEIMGNRHQSLKPFFLLFHIRLKFCFLRLTSSTSANYILRLFIYCIYPKSCTTCFQISNTSLYNKPQVNKPIQIQNASLVGITSPTSVIQISKYLKTIHKTN